MTNTAKLFTTLSEARERLNAVIEHSFDGIFITDAKANVVRVNQGVSRILCKFLRNLCRIFPSEGQAVHQ